MTFHAFLHFTAGEYSTVLIANYGISQRSSANSAIGRLHMSRCRERDEKLHGYSIVVECTQSLSVLQIPLSKQPV